MGLLHAPRARSAARGAFPRRVVIYDPTCEGPGPRPGLSTAWRVGVRLYRALDRIDDWIAGTSWASAFASVLSGLGDAPLQEIQIWSHGKWGLARLDEDVFDAGWLAPGHRGFGLLREVFDRFVPGGRIWFRTCETAGADPGRAFVQRLADTFGLEVYGHTYVIGVFQSGLRRAVPGGRPDWSPWEGLCEGTPSAPVRALASRPWAPSTVHFLSADPVSL